MSDGHVKQAGRVFPVGDVIAGVACLAGSIAFLFMAFALPAGHSTGDTGPGALPIQVGIFSAACSLFYLIIAMRGAFVEERGDFSKSHRALAAFFIFAICLAGVNWIGLALSIALASSLVTMLFPGDRRLVRAAATGLGIWLIAILIFEKLLGLPMP
ncbi:tripartite tricarboxylate transporter TctB family protein [Rhizobium sp. SAFR-030]|uniref:tripartite tricarboxylate transporter TctB family protein n=1 Tax=Rhizobium sp. SAFR-030 TaxID=3387277 RepID=UPI003F8230C5